MKWQNKEGWFHRSKSHVVIRSTGRAIHHTSKAVHRLLALGTGLLVVTSCLLAGAAWRLAQGPIDLGPWSDRIRTALIDNSAPVRVAFDGVFLAWEGFHQGVDHPLDLRLSNITITDRAGHRLVAAPRAHVTFSLPGLMLGRIVPRAVEVDHAQIAVTREESGSINFSGNFDAGNKTGIGAIDIREFREQLSRPVSSDHGRSQGLFDQIQRAHFRNADLTLRDQGSGMVVQTSDMDFDLIRARSGRLHGLLQAPLLIGDQQAGLTANASWTAGSDVRLEMKLTAFRPAHIGSVPPALTFMTHVDVPVSLAAAVEFDAGFEPKQIQADMQLGSGQLQLGNGSVPVRSGSIVLSGMPGKITITKGHFDVAHTPEAKPEIVEIGGIVAHQGDRLSASVTVALSQIAIADLPRLWPAGVGSGARPWVMEHVTGGIAAHATASFAIEADDGLRDVVVTKAVGDLDGTNATFTWLDNVPPVEQADVHLHLVDPDVLDIHVLSGRQHVRSGSDLLIRDGQMRIKGLSVPDQTMVIRARVEGQVTSAVALLKEPRLNLLSTHPIGLKIGGGDASATLDLQFPLQNKLQIDDVQMHADAHLVKVKLLDVVGGRELDDGIFDLGIDKEGLSLKGLASLATVPVALNGTMDFSSGPAEQVVQKIAVTGEPDAAQLDAIGMHVANVLGGPIPLTAVMITRHSGDASVSITGELTLATLAIDPLAWRKPSGSVASASATLLMSHGRPIKIDSIMVRGDGLLLAGSADFVDGHMRSILLDSIRVGRTQGHGTVHLGTNEPVAVVLQGDLIDLSTKLTDKAPTSGRPDNAQATTPNWTLNARFDHALLANEQRASDILVKLTGVGQTISFLDVVGKMNGGPESASSGFSIKIEPRAEGRHLLVDAKDAGSFLRGIDTFRGMRSGHLAIDGAFTGPFGFHPLTATATLDDVLVTNSPVLGKLLQAITLYGLVDVLRGPGMTFSHIVVPFRYNGGDLQIDEAHAYNPSLGVTADGRIGLSSGQTSIAGTIVPAYFFNSMLGQLPLVGKLFSPEKGGGVFAARFGIDGQIDNPSISINPLSALTPGFLRQIFSVFDRNATNKDSFQAEGK